MTKEERELIEMMYNTGNYLVTGIGGFYWANANHKGCLIKAATDEEIYIVQNLVREGRGGVKLETKKLII